MASIYHINSEQLKTVGNKEKTSGSLKLTTT